ncbi:MAG: discoidin domain-containing protein, partial [Duncaniella sp.]|nr:discoidin domain-containing protein [Duncaniella sp.]
TVRGNADCYIVNLALRTAYRALDLFTNKCDRHYVDYLCGHAFMNVIRIGGDSEDGYLANTQFNTGTYAYGDETKNGQWPNSLGMADDTMQWQAYCQNERDLEFLMVGDCSREFLYNNFLFGCNKGMWFIPDKKGGARDCRSLGNAVDGAVQTFVIDGIATDLDMVNSQIVALAHNTDNEKHSSVVSPYIPAYFIKIGDGIKGRTVNFFSSNNWGSGDYMIDIASGTVNIAMTNMAASGSKYTFNVAEGAKVNVFNGRFNNMKRTLADNSVAPRVSVNTSEIEFKTGSLPADIDWKYNLTPAWEFADISGLLPRDGWNATASENNNTAYMAIDGLKSTRWEAIRQQPGQWFAVNFNKDLSFNVIIMDSTPSGGGDGPAGYKVEVWKYGAWVEVASGTNGSANCVVVFETQNSNQVRVTQTGTKSNYWSINE